MDRRTFLKAAALGSITSGLTASMVGAERYFPAKVDPSLFENINRVKDPAKKTPLEMKHAPFLSAPASVKAGEPFTVEVSIGEVVHDMGETHWIEFISLAIGNEPAGRVDFQPRGFLKPKATFIVVIPREAAPAGKATLVALEKCNLHGYWEGSLNITVT